MTYQPDLGQPTFYLTTHRPNWLWDGRVDYPLMVSFRTLRTVRHLHPAAVPEWALDSGGFMELSQFGRWTIPAREYVEAVARYDSEIGGLGWCPVQDHMCEPGVIYGGKVGRTVSPGTRHFIDPGERMTFDQLVGEHHRHTIASYHELTGLWPEYSDNENPFMPVLQGWHPRHYQAHRELYKTAGIDLAGFPLVGIGSVCRRSDTSALADVAAVINEMDLAAHWFGVKLTAIDTGAVVASQMQARGEWWPCGAASFDSASWSKDALHNPRLPGCAHVGKDGLPNRCNNCAAYATWYRATKVMTRLAAAQARHDTGDNLPSRPATRPARAA